MPRDQYRLSGAAHTAAPIAKAKVPIISVYGTSGLPCQSRQYHQNVNMT